MPSRTRSTRSVRQKENIGVTTKSKVINKVVKPQRKPLGDKTNSASDDNDSVQVLKKVVAKPTIKTTKTTKDVRPRRDRRLPTRFVENAVLNNLSNNKENTSTSDVSQDKSPEVKSKQPAVVSPFVTPQKLPEISLVANRPKRIHRLPSKFHDHSISPNKFIPVQPCHASTPIINKQQQSHILKATTPIISKQKKTLASKSTPSSTNKQNSSQTSGEDSPIDKLEKSKAPKASAPVTRKRKTTQAVKAQSKVASVKTRNKTNKASNADISQKKITEYTSKVKADTNNNANLRTRRTNNKSPLKNTTNPKNLSSSPKKRIVSKNFSFRVLENVKKKNKSSEPQNDMDVYEFTFDPNEEPAPKKKKKKAVRKKPAKPKTVVVKNNYDLNLSKTLVGLKEAVGKKTNQNQVTNLQNNGTDKQSQLKITKPTQPQTVVQANNIAVPSKPNLQQNTSLPNVNTTIPKPSTSGNTLHNTIVDKNYASIRVEDIAADFEQDSFHDNIDYSPVNSPHPNKSVREPAPVHQNHDPLNLREDLSFFDAPVASSSMNVSARHPTASPWRVEFNNLPIKWHVNTYIKPNMTPAVESSFVNFNDSKKKHVYTNLGTNSMEPETNTNLPQIFDNDAPKLKQASIISFIKEVVERKANKKKRARSGTPNRGNIFENIEVITEKRDVNKTPRQLSTPRKDAAPAPLADITPENNETSNENVETEQPGQKRKNTSDIEGNPAKTPRKDNTCFGFDDSENQENISPVKNIPARALRPRVRQVLQDLNTQSGPTRAALAVKSKPPSSDAANKLYDEMKSASDAPVFPEKDVDNPVQTNVEEAALDVDDDDDQSVHLFVDIELVHHLKPTRKSYGGGRNKKVTFQSTFAPDAAFSDEERADSDDDTSFRLPSMKIRKPAKKKTSKKDKRTKKEEEEVEKWAAGFNSMCEDVEGFDLLIE